MIIGCCGFSIKGGQKAYYNTFKLVELQSTFYKLPKLETAERWRQEAPEDFEFVVKCWQVITHPPTSSTWRKARFLVEKDAFDRYGLLRPTDENFKAWNQTKEICIKLKTNICLIQCPPQFNYTSENEDNMKSFFNKIDRQSIKVAWEPRGDWREHSSQINRLCKELDLIHVTDILRYKPEVTGKTVYIRLHGLNPREYDYKYKYSALDLQLLREKVKNLEEEGVEKVYVLFNNIHMAQDSLAFQSLINGINW